MFEFFGGIDLRTVLVAVAFIVLVIVPVLLELDELRERFHDLREGWKGIFYVPLLWVLLFTGAGIGYLLAQHITILQWGWLGHNIIAEPLVSGAESAENGSASDGSGNSFNLFALVFVPVMLIAFLLFNYREEEYYRDSWGKVVVWAVIHLIMGIPIWAVIPIFSIGIGFKLLYDYKGIEVAFAAHFFSNSALITLAVASLIFF